jgi:hypothetical protein
MKMNLERVEFYLGHICRGHHFEINLCRYGVELNDSIYENVLDKFVIPLVAVSDRAALFRVARMARERTSNAASARALSEKGTLMTDINLQETAIGNSCTLWRSMIKREDGDEATLVLSVPAQGFPIKSVAGNSWDPHYLSNPGSIASREALTFCRRTARTGSHVVCLFTKSAMGLSLSFYATDELLKKLYVECVRRCQFTGKGLEKELRGAAKKAKPKKRP